MNNSVFGFVELFHMYEASKKAMPVDTAINTFEILHKDDIGANKYYQIIRHNNWVCIKTVSNDYLTVKKDKFGFCDRLVRYFAIPHAATRVGGFLESF